MREEARFEREKFANEKRESPRFIIFFNEQEQISVESGERKISNKRKRKKERRKKEISN